MPESVPFAVIGAPPPDVESLRLFAWVTTSVILSLSTITLILRYAARWKQFKGLKLDDYLISAGYLIALMPAICIYICKSAKGVLAEALGQG